MSWLKNIELDKTLLGLVLFSVGLILFIALSIYLLSDLSIWVFGKTVLGEVVQLEYVEVGLNSNGEPVFEYSIVYEFTTTSGRRLVGTSSVSVTEWSSLWEGAPVLVGYFPLYPAHNRLDNVRFIPVYFVGYVIILILSIFGLAGGWGMLRPIRGGRKAPYWTEILQRKDESN